MEYRHETMQMGDYSMLNELIDDMTTNVFEELDASKKYAMAAIKHKDIDKSMAEQDISTSTDEYGHAEMICKKIDKMFEKLKEENHECYEWLHLVWTKTYERVIAYMAWIKGLHEQYKH